MLLLVNDIVHEFQRNPPVAASRGTATPRSSSQQAYGQMPPYAQPFHPPPQPPQPPPPPYNHPVVTQQHDNSATVVVQTQIPSIPTTFPELDEFSYVRCTKKDRRRSFSDDDVSAQETPIYRRLKFNSCVYIYLYIYIRMS